MTNPAPLYDPPVDPNLGEMRKDILSGEDQEMFVHVGHFVSWFGAVDMILGLILHHFSGDIPPPEFDVLTRGLDAKTKLHRLEQSMALSGWTMAPALKRRLEHFKKVHIGIRNKLVHSYLYWPEGGDLQICGVGNPPIFADVTFDAAPPQQIPGAVLFERGAWLSLLCQDLTDIFNAFERPKPHGGVLGADSYRSGLPSGAPPDLPQ